MDRTPEDRLNRIERIAKLFVRTGRCARGTMRDHDEKINILINLHIENEERFARNEERFKANEVRFKENEARFKENEARSAKRHEKLDEKIAIILARDAQLQERFARTDEIIRENAERFARTDEAFRQAQANSDRRFDALIETIRADRNSSS